MTAHIHCVLREYIKGLLTELRVIKLGDVDKNYNIFVYKGWLVKYPENEFPPWEEIQIETGLDLGDIPDSVHYDKIGTDYLVGTVHDNELKLSNSGVYSHNPISSNLVKRVADFLGIKIVNGLSIFDDKTESQIDRDFYRFEVLGKLPKILWHGTSSDSLFGETGILKIGLMPGVKVNKSNWKGQNIWHDDVISLVVSKELAYYHAHNASARQKKGFPVLVGVSVPDSDRIVSDYDIDSNTGKTTNLYKHVRQRSKYVNSSNERYGRGPEKTSVDVGVIGYEGRIPAKFINTVLYWSEQNEDWVYGTIKELREMQEMFDEFGPDYYEVDRSEFENFE